jgi:hypothetical protein
MAENFIEILRKGRSGTGMFFPLAIFCQYQKKDDCAYLTAQTGHALTHEEWEQLKQIVDRFYSEVSSDDITRFNKETTLKDEEEERIRSLPSPKVPRQPKPGHVYVIFAETGRCKIGRTNNLNARLNQLATASPVLFKLLHAFQSSDTEKAERFLHDKFKDKRNHREWFNLDKSDRQYLQSIGDFSL